LRRWRSLRSAEPTRCTRLKHNPFVNFAGTQNALAQMVPDIQLGLDLATGHLPDYSLVVPDQCNDMHGTGGCPSGAPLVKRAPAAAVPIPAAGTSQPP
jgi:hypothetical protein